MEKCYRYELIKNKNGFFDNIIDAVYIIHLENNGRLDSVMNQLNQYKVCKTTYILFNKGFKKCKKAEHINMSYLDLTDAFINVFNHAESKNYNNILIFEDDFIIDKDIENHVNNIEDFFNKHKNENFLYSLGSIPSLMYPTIDLNHYRLLLSAGTHAIIYTKLCRQKILNEKRMIIDFDFFRNIYIKNYTYYKPLVYQIFNETENYKNWSNSLNMKIVKQLIHIFKLDKEETVINGSKNFFLFGKVLSLTIFLIILLIIYKFIKYNNGKML